MPRKLNYNDIKPALKLATSKTKELVIAGINGDADFPKLLAEYKWSGTRDYNMALIIIAFYAYCIRLDADKEIKDFGRTILRNGSMSSNMLESLREGNGDKIKYYMGQYFRETMERVLKRYNELDGDSDEKKEQRKKIIENFVKQAGKIKRWKINKHAIEMLILKLQNKQLAEELTNKQQAVERVPGNNKGNGVQQKNYQLIKELKNKLAKGKKNLGKKNDEIIALVGENYRKNKALFEKYNSKFKNLASRFKECTTSNDPDFANLILDFCECCADFYNDIDSKLISKDMEEENALYTLVSNFVENKNLFQNTLASFAKVDIEEIGKCINNDGFTSALGAVLQCKFENKEQRKPIVSAVQKRAGEVRDNHVLSPNINKIEVQKKVGGVNKIIELKDKKNAEKSSKKQQETENDIDLSTFFGDEKIEAKENKYGSDSEKNNEAVEKEKQDSNKKVEIENEKDKEKEKKPEEEQKQSGNQKNNSEKGDSVDAMKANPEIKQNDSQKSEVKAEKEVSDWEVIDANNKNQQESQQESQQAGSDVHVLIKNMAKNYIENGDLSIFPPGFQSVKVIKESLKEKYDKGIVLKELKEHLIKKGLGKEEVDVLFDNFINVTAEKCDGHLYFSCDVNGVKKSVQADVGLWIKDLGITSIPESIKYKFINTDKFKSLFKMGDISDMLDNAPDTLPKCSDNKKIYDLFFSNFFKNGENEFTLEQAFACLNGVETYKELGMLTRGKFKLAKGLIPKFAPLDKIMIPLNWLIYAYDIRIQK